MGHTAAGKAHKARTNRGKRFGKVFPQTVLTPFERFSREKRHHVDVRVRSGSE